MQAGTEKHICQVAFCAHDGPFLREWYANVFGLVKSGKIIFFPPATARVQGIPGAWEKCGWLIDQQDYFQLEFFQFWNPRPKLRRGDWRPSDIGYTMLGIAVNDFEQVLRNVCAFSAVDRPAVAGEDGDRRACVSDPEGNLVEIYERDPLIGIPGADSTVLRPEVPAVVRTMRVSVPALEDARRAWVEAMGLQVVEDFQLHTAADEARWGLPEAQVDSLLLRSANFLVELVQYRSPEPRGWPEGYRICDQGFMNIALGYRDNRDYESSFARATAQGMRANGPVANLGAGRVMYVNDPHGFSVEMLTVRKPLWYLFGFSSHEPYVENEIEIDAPARDVWRQLTNHSSLGAWSMFDGGVLRPGRDDPNGLGCLRELRGPGGLRITEEVTAWEEGRHYAYQLRTGAPFRRHQGDVFVTEKNGSSQVRWAIRFESWIPFTGWITARLLQLVFSRALQNLKRRMEAYHPQSQA